MNLFTTIKGSLMEQYLPKGWDLEKLAEIANLDAKEVTKRQDFWHDQFNPVGCRDIYQFNTLMGHEIATQIKEARDSGGKLAMILPVGPMGMYEWAVFFLKSWGVSADHVYTFPMDEWSDREGNTLSPTNPGSFQYGLENAFFKPLGELTVPEEQRFYATKETLPKYAEEIKNIKDEGGKLVVVYGIGRVFHIAFWEPQFAEEYTSEEDWKKDTHRIAANLHPLTIEQNALTSFKSNTTAVPCFSNTIGPGLFLQADYAIGGADGVFGRGMIWQGLSLRTTFRYGPDIWVPSSFMPTIPGKLFYLEELAGSLQADLN